MRFWSLETSEPKTRAYVVRLLGANGANPTEQVGRGLTVARTGEGVYRITWADNPVTFLAIAGYCFGAATASDVKGYTLTRDTYDATNKQLDLYVWDSTFTAADIIADQYLDVTILFKETALAT